MDMKHVSEMDFDSALRVAQAFADRNGLTLRLEPEVSCAFPPGDVGIPHLVGNELRLPVSLLSLLGAVSPLPAWFVDHAARVETVSGPLATFLQPFAQRLLLLFSQARELAVQADCCDALSEELCLQGTGKAAIAALLARACNAPVKLVEYVSGMIPLYNRSLLGTAGRLGIDSCIGTAGTSAAAGMELMVGPLAVERLGNIGPDTAGMKNLVAYARKIIGRPLAVSLCVVVEGGGIRPMVLGSGRAKLSGMQSLGRAAALQILR